MERSDSGVLQPKLNRYLDLSCQNYHGSELIICRYIYLQYIYNICKYFVYNNCSSNTVGCCNVLPWIQVTLGYSVLVAVVLGLEYVGGTVLRCSVGWIIGSAVACDCW